MKIARCILALTLLAGCVGPQLPSSVSEKQAREVMKDVALCERQIGYTVTIDDCRNGMTNVNNPRQQLMYAALKGIARVHGIDPNEFMLVVECGKSRGW